MHLRGTEGPLPLLLLLNTWPQQSRLADASPESWEKIHSRKPTRHTGDLRMSGQGASACPALAPPSRVTVACTSMVWPVLGSQA